MDDIVIAATGVYPLLVVAAYEVGRRVADGFWARIIDGVMTIGGWPLDAVKGRWWPVRVLGVVAFIPWWPCVLATYAPVLALAILGDLITETFKETA